MCAGGFRDRHRGCYRHSVLLICKINQKRRNSRRHDAKKSLNTLAYFDTEHGSLTVKKTKKHENNWFTIWWNQFLFVPL